MSQYAPQSWDNDIAADNWMEQFSEMDNLHVAYDPMDSFEDYLAHYYLAATTTGAAMELWMHTILSPKS